MISSGQTGIVLSFCHRTIATFLIALIWCMCILTIQLQEPIESKLGRVAASLLVINASVYSEVRVT
jgi:hypothetical protein